MDGFAEMEVGAPNDCAVSGPVRIKLLFEDRHILSPHQLADGLGACWFVVRPHLPRISDLAFDIASTFHLSKTCPHGISLRMENFTLPPPQPTWLLKDNDTVSVVKKEGHVMLALPDVKLANSLSLDDSDTVDKHGLTGVNLRAVEEFEKETGGYQSEEEEDAREALDEHLECLDLLPTGNGIAKGKVKKKRKRGGEECVDEQVQCCKQRTEGDMRKKDKRVKKGNLTMQQGIAEVKVLQEDKISKGQKLQNDTQIVSLKLAEKPRKNDRSSEGESRKNEANIEVKPTKKKDGTQKRSSQDKKLMDLEKDLVMEAGVETIKKPSRSTIRKKAKRRWKRQHSEGLAAASKEKQRDCNIDSKLHPVQVHLASPYKNKDDGEAEEENLPVLVRPGHIRFEPLDEDEENCHAQHFVPRLSWHDGVSKRQGQSWGQQKEKGKGGGKKYRESVSTEPSECGEIVFEALPLLKVTPQVNDIIAYRLVELTSSMCPELSEYRVGKVAELESQSGMLKLVPLPSYPLKHSLEDEQDHDTSFPFPYNQDGSLETNLVSLLEVRLMNGSSNDKSRCQDTQVQTRNVLTQTENHVTQSAEAMVQSRNCKADDAQDALALSSKFLSSKELTVHSSTVEVSAFCHSELSNEGMTSSWQELSEALDKKKQELSRLEGITEQNGNTELDEVEKRTVNVCSGQNVNKQGGPQNRSWSFRSMRTGALGPTVALLRAQNVL